MLSVSTLPSSALFYAVPLSSTGTLLDDDPVRIAIALLSGLPVCQPHRCRSGTQIDKLGLYPLSCRRSDGRCIRHHGLNDVIKRALDTAGFPSILEPTCLSREDGKRPDGVTLFHFSSGKCLVWDVICGDTFSSSNLIRSALHPSQAAADAERRERSKYVGISSTYDAQPVSFQTSGACGPDTPFLKQSWLHSC